MSQRRLDGERPCPAVPLMTLRVSTDAATSADLDLSRRIRYSTAAMIGWPLLSVTVRPHRRRARRTTCACCCCCCCWAWTSSSGTDIWQDADWPDLRPTCTARAVLRTHPGHAVTGEAYPNQQVKAGRGARQHIDRNGFPQGSRPEGDTALPIRLDADPRRHDKRWVVRVGRAQNPVDDDAGTRCRRGRQRRLPRADDEL